MPVLDPTVANKIYTALTGVGFSSSSVNTLISDIQYSPTLIGELNYTMAATGGVAAFLNNQNGDSLNVTNNASSATAGQFLYSSNAIQLNVTQQPAANPDLAVATIANILEAVSERMRHDRPRGVGSRDKS